MTMQEERAQAMHRLALAVSRPRAGTIQQFANGAGASERGAAHR
jgi:hypothetical protein